MALCYKKVIKATLRRTSFNSLPSRIIKYKRTASLSAIISYWATKTTWQARYSFKATRPIRVVVGCFSLLILKIPIKATSSNPVASLQTWLPNISLKISLSLETLLVKWQEKPLPQESKEKRRRPKSTARVVLLFRLLGMKHLCICSQHRKLLKRLSSCFKISITITILTKLEYSSQCQFLNLTMGSSNNAQLFLLQIQTLSNQRQSETLIKGAS